MENTPAPVVSLPQIGFVPSNLPTTQFFEIALYVILLVYIVFTLVLFYHWYAYANNRATATATCAAYLVITVPMILTLITTTVIL